MRICVLSSRVGLVDFLSERHHEIVNSTGEYENLVVDAEKISSLDSFPKSLEKIVLLTHYSAIAPGCTELQSIYSVDTPDQYEIASGEMLMDVIANAKSLHAVSIRHVDFFEDAFDLSGSRMWISKDHFFNLILTALNIPIYPGKARLHASSNISSVFIHDEKWVELSLKRSDVTDSFGVDQYEPKDFMSDYKKFITEKQKQWVM